MRAIRLALATSIWQIKLSPGRAIKINHHSISGVASESKCFVFHSQHKSAGNTIEETLWFEKFFGYNDTASDIIRCDEWQFDDKLSACPMPSTVKEPYVLMKGYVLTMANQDIFSHDRCTWFTMFREPVSRLVSSYFYCKHNEWDPLCGSKRLRAARATIEQWADHWGNFLFRELLLYPPILEEAMPQMSNVTCNALCKMSNVPCNALCKQHSFSGDNVWYSWKIALGEGQNLTSEAGQRNIQLVEKHLRGSGVPRMYHMFGITTQFETSMKFFDHLAPLHAPWAELTARHAKDHGSAKYEEREKQVLQAARENTHVLKALEADLKIYNEMVVPLFHSMASSFAARMMAEHEVNLD